MSKLEKYKMYYASDVFNTNFNGIQKEDLQKKKTLKIHPIQENTKELRKQKTYIGPTKYNLFKKENKIQDETFWDPEIDADTLSYINHNFISIEDIYNGNNLEEKKEKEKNNNDNSQNEENEPNLIPIKAKDRRRKEEEKRRKKKERRREEKKGKREKEKRRREKKDRL